ncbi:hypothetical protein [Natronolimnohabitans innermongolicus]|uniref:Uncharacterized protein n=1 Tax=Natronolimnohabitans innermongolicus JCM 12255 TaxID=1227499 RepID=L9WSS8_9EURY|nr:hypothetical protein [Natronolimnohabitans innermongolicus]ELY52519.1 hypothetical protein C493_15760 [Natronolimnohabitans innermongolicus JCM 12255]
MNRRELVSAIGAGTAAGMAGCTALFEEDAAVELLRVGVINWTDEATAVQVRVILGEAVVEEVTYEFEPEDSGRVLDCTWPSDPGHFVVAARLDADDEWEERDVTDPDESCAAVHVMVHQTTTPPSMPVSRECEFHADNC